MTHSPPSIAACAALSIFPSKRASPALLAVSRRVAVRPVADFEASRTASAALKYSIVVAPSRGAARRQQARDRQRHSDGPRPKTVDARSTATARRAAVRIGLG